ncbi:hypothetical protein JX266_014079 [Neoarthrinium moseri]|nr:hypothetical protein JX266_014079 [Neoarthrinium moseri]
MDPFSITVGALGITDFAISSIEKLHNSINNLVEAKDVVQDIATNLEAVQRPLAALAGITMLDQEAFDAAKDDLKKTGVVEAVNHCGQACDDFTKKLEKWTKHSSDQKLSLRDRFSVGLWNREKISTFRTRVQCCQATVQFAVDSTQLIVQLRSERNSNIRREELRKELQLLERTIQVHIDRTNKQQEDAQKRVEELEKDRVEEEDEAEQTLAIREVKDRSRLLEADLNSAKTVSSQVRSKLKVQHLSTTITATFGDNNSGFQAGNINGGVSGLTFGRNT